MERFDPDTLEPVYVLVSSEPLLIDRTLTALRDAAVPEAVRAFNYDVVDGKGGSAARVVAAAQTVPMMSARRMVLVREVGAMAAAELAGLLPYLDDPSPSTVLVATASKIDKRLKFFATAGKKKYIHELKPPRDVAGWVAKEATRRKVNIQRPAIARLVEVVGADLSRLSLSLEQLSLYAGGRTIESDDVDDLVAETRERSVFELSDAIGAGDRHRALAAVAALSDQRQSAIGVVAMLARYMRQLALYRAGSRDGMGGGELARVLGVPPFVVDKLGRQARRYSDASLDRAIAALSETDRALKGEGQVQKALGRALGERVLLGRLVDQLVLLGAPAGGASGRTARR